MLIATFNCNSVRMRLGLILKWLEEHDPDVLALQETKVVDDLFPAGDFEAAGWHVAFCGQKAYNGVAVVTREAPEEVSFGMQDGDEGESNTRFAHVRYQGVHVVNTYVPQGQALDSPKFEYKQEWLRRLRAYFQRRIDFASDQIAWVGDVNIAPTPADVYDHKKIWPNVVHCQEMTDALASFTELGFVDVFRKHLPEPEVYTFWDYRHRNAVKNNRGWRIDHIQASRALADRSEECYVDLEPRRAEKPSDHTFVAARFR